MFQWNARSELYNLLDIVLKVDYLDEVKFARTAAARARTGAQIVSLTHRLAGSRPANPLMAPDSARAWGVSGWASRAGQGALLDWAVANALLPEQTKKDLNGRDAEGLARIDRSSVPELAEISASHSLIQSKYDLAADGLNSFGFSKDTIAFDIDPVRVDRSHPNPATHFEQIWERAVKSAANAVTAWDYANQSNKRIRQVGESVEMQRHKALEQDLTYRNRLIEMFGMPYEGTIGPGQAYPAGYVGPDLLLYMYVDQKGLRAKDLPSIDEKADKNFIDARDEFIDYYNDNLGSFSSQPGMKKELTKGATDFNQIMYQPILSSPRPARLELPFVQGPRAVFQVPEKWGKRKANGKLQDIYARMLLAEFDLKRKLVEYESFVKSIDGAEGKLEEAITYQEDIRAWAAGVKATLFTLKETQTASKAISVAAKLLKDFQKDVVAKTAEDTGPRVTGIDNDYTWGARLALKLVVGSTAAGHDLTQMSALGAENLAKLAEDGLRLSEEIRGVDRKKSRVAGFRREGFESKVVPGKRPET